MITVYGPETAALAGLSLDFLADIISQFRLRHGCFQLRIARGRLAFQTLHHTTRTGRNQTPNNDVFFQTDQAVHLAGNGRFGQHPCGFLERSSGNERARLQRCFGNPQQNRFRYRKDTPGPRLQVSEEQVERARKRLGELKVEAATAAAPEPAGAKRESKDRGAAESRRKATPGPSAEPARRVVARAKEAMGAHRAGGRAEPSSRRAAGGRWAYELREALLNEYCGN